MTPFRNEIEMAAVIGKADNNSFVKQVGAETVKIKDAVAAIKTRGWWRLRRRIEYQKNP